MKNRNNHHLFPPNFSSYAFHPMELDHGSKTSLSGQPYNNSMKLEEMDDVFVTVSNDYLQDFHHLDLTFSHPHDNFMIETNSYDPLFDPFSTHEDNYSSMDQQDFNYEFYESFEQSGASGSTLVMRNNFENYSMDTNRWNESLLSFSCDEMKPVNYANHAPDESSCITADNNGIDKEIGGRKNKKIIKSQSSSTSKLGRGRQKSKSAKGQWTIEEDRILIHLVEKFGVRKWSQIAQILKGRIGKQCRERWHNHLRPDIKKDLWTEEEDRILIEAHAEVGNKWTEIAKRLPGRTENSIKNHWNATKRREFSRRKVRTKWPRPSSLLQNYIKRLNFEKGSSSSHATKTNNTDKLCDSGNNIQQQLINADYDFSEVPEFAFDDKLLDENISIVDHINDKCLDLEIPYDELHQLISLT